MMHRGRAVALILAVVLAGCGEAVPRSAAAAPTSPATIAAQPQASSGPEAVRVRVMGSPRVDGGVVRICGPSEQCAGVIVAGPHAAAVAAAADRPDAIVSQTGWYDGTVLETDGPPEILALDDRDPPLGTPCDDVQGTAPPRPADDEEWGNPPEGAFEALHGWIAKNRDRYATSWWDRETWSINVLLADDDTAGIADLLSRRIAAAVGYQPGGDIGVCVTGGAPSTERELDAAAQRLHEALEGLPDVYGIDGSGPDPRRGVVGVTASRMDVPTVDALTAAAGVPVEVWAFLTVLDGTVDDLPPYSGGRKGTVPLDVNASRGGAGMDARGTFAVRYDAELGCVYLDDGDGRAAALWPFGYTADADPLRIYDADGALVLEEADGFTVGGGWVPAVDLDHPCGGDEREVFIMTGRPQRQGR